MKLKKKHFSIVALAAAIILTVALGSAQNQHTLQGDEMDEISGIAASRINKNIFYVHNDSGDTSRFFAIDPEGQLKETFYFEANPANKNENVIDCEDIDVGPGPQKGKTYVYLGDIGDNHSQRNSIVIYRFREPVVNENQTKALLKADAIRLKYPDGAHDAETLMVDPIEKQLYIITKRESSVGVYTAPLSASLKDTTTMQLQCKIHFPGLPLFKWITAGDISADGQKVLVKSYENVFYWKRQANEPIWKTLQAKPEKLHYKVEKQGEAIGFTANGKGYYTTSEGKHAPIYYYQTPR